MLSRVLRRQLAVARLHTSVPRQNIIQDLYLSEIKAFKPKPVSEKDSADVVIPWKTPVAPKAPAVEGDAAEVDAYASAPVEVETAAVSSESAAAEADWFPIEDDVEEPHH